MELVEPDRLTEGNALTGCLEVEPLTDDGRGLDVAVAVGDLVVLVVLVDEVLDAATTSVAMEKERWLARWE